MQRVPFRRGIIGAPPGGDGCITKVAGSELYAAYTGKSVLDEEVVPEGATRSRGEQHTLWAWYSLFRFGEPVLKPEGHRMEGTSWAPNSHHDDCCAGYFAFGDTLYVDQSAPVDYRWETPYTSVLKASTDCHLCLFLSTVVGSVSPRLGNIEETIIYGRTFQGRWDLSRLWMMSLKSHALEDVGLLQEVIRWRTSSCVGYQSSWEVDRREWQAQDGSWLQEKEVVQKGGKGVGLTVFYPKTGTYRRKLVVATS
jgi:hypothetical protein